MNKSVTLITGGGGLLGLQHARAVLEMGSIVLLADINNDAMEKNLQQLKREFSKGIIYAFKVDITNEKSVLNLLSKISLLGIIVNVLINNASVNPGMKNSTELELTRLENFSVEQWDYELNVGLKGAFLCSKIFGKEMAINNISGVIINIASDLSVISPDQRLYSVEGLQDSCQPVKPITYSVIKAGLVGLTKYLATYWSEKNIRCNSLSPGGVYDNHSEEFVVRLSKLIPLGRMANKDEYISAIQFLCSDASSYMNGHNLIIDGGRTVW
jgi:NAD(P)-dependent dehydrogenase (short-subunit alcohol dehydrogenase family)